MPQPNTPSAISVRTGDRERHPPGTVVEVKQPDDISPHAAEVWNELVPALAKSGALRPTDISLLVELVECFGRLRLYRRAWNEAAAEGTVEHIDRNGKVTEVPFMGSQEEKRLRTGIDATLTQARSLAAEYGLTPSARAKMGLLDATKSATLGSILDDLDAE